MIILGGYVALQDAVPVAGDTWFESVLAVVAAQPIVRHIKSTKITSTERIKFPGVRVLATRVHRAVAEKK